MIKIMSHLAGVVTLKNVVQSLFSRCKLMGKSLLEPLCIRSQSLDTVSNWLQSLALIPGTDCYLEACNSCYRDVIMWVCFKIPNSIFIFHLHLIFLLVLVFLLLNHRCNRISRISTNSIGILFLTQQL